MKTSCYLAAIVGLVIFGSTRAADKPASPVEVTFVDPQNFTDVKDDVMDSDRGREYLLGQLKDELQKSAGKSLTAGQHLEVKVTDVDLAGSYEPQRGPRLDNVRFMRDIYPPRMNLEFKLTDAQGKVVSEGKRRLLNLSYLMSASMANSDPLRYDKELIDDWVRTEFKRAS